LFSSPLALPSHVSTTNRVLAIKSDGRRRPLFIRVSMRLNGSPWTHAFGFGVFDCSICRTATGVSSFECCRHSSTSMLPAQQVNFPVYTKSLNEVIIVPSERVYHVPAKDRLEHHYATLCDDFDPGLPLSCSRGTSCKYVHADVRGLKRSSVHINYAWPSLSHVTYERYSADRTLRVTSPNARCVVDTMHASFVLKTQGLDTAKKLSHCAHYYYNRVCHLGPECQFVHAIFVDPEAQPGQRAPDPSRLFDRRAGLSKRQWMCHFAKEGPATCSRDPLPAPGRSPTDSLPHRHHRGHPEPQYLVGRCPSHQNTAESHPPSQFEPFCDDRYAEVVSPSPVPSRIYPSIQRHTLPFRFDPYNTFTGITVIRQSIACP
jgi:hypothetical protein